jgi:hypothetical protein
MSVSIKSIREFDTTNSVLHKIGLLEALTTMRIVVAPTVCIWQAMRA